MKAGPDALASASRTWRLDLAQYDRTPALSDEELEALEPLHAAHGWGGRTIAALLSTAAGAERLMRPLHDALAVLEGNAYWKERALIALLRGCLWEGRAFWAWPPATWSRLLGADSTRLLTANRPNRAGATRHYMIAAAYVLGCLPDVTSVPHVSWLGVAQKVFGHEAVDASVAQVEAALDAWGYSRGGCRAVRSVIAEVLLMQGSPRLEDLTVPFLNRMRPMLGSTRARGLITALSRALTEAGILELPVTVQHIDRARLHAARTARIAPEWAAWVARWEETSTLAPKSRHTIRHWLLKLGRWLHAAQPEIREPGQWTRETAAAAIAAIDRMHVGDYTWLRQAARGDGRPLSPRAKAAAIRAWGRAFQDAQEWGWIPRRFSPGRALATPRSILALIGPAPRTTADDVWAKLLWAGLHLSVADAKPSHPVGAGHAFYPANLVRAVAVVWLFAGLRSDELLRLRVGCIRWQRAADEDSAVCLLEVPVNKTGQAYTKPVDRVVGEAIARWAAERPAQPARPDRKTGEVVDLLFSFRARSVTARFLNHSVIPLLCRKAGVPLADAKGAITTHRARSTIASQLYNAKEPMSLFELQAWLGHRSPQATQHYARITPTTLAKAYADAGYFARNVRTIEVLVDREAVQSGTAAAGQPWQYFDLGHGYCTYSFFEQCPHRMACARCDFYLPKGSTKAQLLEARGNLQRMLAQMPLTDDERAAVEDGSAAVERLLERLADVPTPAGPTPRELVGGPGFIPLSQVADSQAHGQASLR